MKDEQKLMLQVQTGTTEAFGILVEDLISSAYRTAYLVLRSKDMAEDAVQNALEDAYLSIVKGLEIKNFKAWFYRLVYNRSVDLFRKSSRIHTVGVEDNPEAEEKMLNDSALQKAIARENRQEMINLVKKLDTEQSIPLLLYYFEDMSINDIALSLGENVNTIKTRLKRGKKKLTQMANQKSLITGVYTDGAY